jgi:hypothetical protein
MYGEGRCYTYTLDCKRTKTFRKIYIYIYICVCVYTHICTYTYVCNEWLSMNEDLDIERIRSCINPLKPNDSYMYQLVSNN